MEFLFLIPFFILLIAFIPRFLATRRVDMTWDEGLYIACGAMSLKNVATRNFSSEAWSFEFHPPVIMYLYGVTYALYVWLSTLVRRRSIPSIGILYQEGLKLFSGRKTLSVARLTSVMLGSLSCVIVYFMCLDLFKSRLMGVVAALVLALTPSFIAWSSLAMLESGVAFFFLLTIWALTRAVELNSFCYLIISGISLGLTFGSKETGFGVPIVVLPWFVSLAFKSKASLLSDVALNIGQAFLLWIALGFLTFYVIWPWLWKNPITQFLKAIRATSHMTSRKGAGWSFYLTNLFMSTPLAVGFLYTVGLIESLFLSLAQPYFLLLSAWVIVPLALMSSPLVPKRGGTFEVSFVFVPLSILSSFAIYSFSKLITENTNRFLMLSLNNWFMFLLLSFILVSLLAIACVKIHPYYVDYYNSFSKMRRNCLIGWWGEGMAEAVAYIDQNAPKNSSVWIYGPKATAFYHTSRINLKESIGKESLFYERSKSGIDVQISKDFCVWREGDLKFCFPYYYPIKDGDLDVAQLKAENVSYILVYRWATYDPAITAMAPDHHRVVSMLRSSVPAFTSKIKGEEVCWVYKVGDLMPKT
jgi:4-amino-4-deoxy-L-arabinose transferase-like glycosyltransferase